ncbi:DUF5047 domain-containing protein [Streptomyces sp. NBC_01590]|uniref:DUF5047 domain-containing protein n=1 Tax=Streptomyces sp. NBC_01590 TaxID=2975887 RepID=UPI00386C0B98
MLTQVTLFRTDGQVVELPNTGGSVQVDAGAAIRRSCTVTSADVSLIPTSPTDQLAVYGARMRIARGLDFGDGTSEVIPLGVFRLDDVGGDPLLGPVALTGTAIECIIQDDLFTTPYRAAGTVSTAITALIQRSIPDADVIVTSTDPVIGSRTWDTGTDPWAAVQEIAAVAGAQCYTSADGTFMVSPLPDLLTATPAWTVAAGEGGVYVKGSRGMSAVGVNNGVLARGENAADGVAPVQWLATDDDSGSPTYWAGPYGRRPTVYSSSMLTTQSACRNAAQLLLAEAKAPNATGDFSSLPNPALEPGDVLRVIHPDGLRELHQVKSFTVPLEVGGDFPIATISARGDS